jgi:hypothetical protein
MEEPGSGAYYVVYDGYRYTFEAPATPTAGPLLRSDGTANSESESESGPESDSGSTPGSDDERPAPLEDGGPVANSAGNGSDASE